MVGKNLFLELGFHIESKRPPPPPPPPPPPRHAAYSELRSLLFTLKPLTFDKND